MFTNIRDALRSLKTMPGRTILTVLGITIGVASITAILSLAAGASGIITSQVNKMENNLAIVRPGAPKKGASLASLGAQTTISTQTITEADWKNMEKITHVEVAAPLMTVATNIQYDKKNIAANVVATTPELSQTTELPLLYGGFITNGAEANTVVVGQQLSVNLFGTDNSVGQVLNVSGKDFTVIGVIKQLDQPINFNQIDFDNAALINIEMGKNLSQDVIRIQQVNVRAESVDHLAAVTADINKMLLENHNSQEDFSIMSGDSIAQPFAQMFSIVSSIVTTAASISVLVGGIGIMNIMLVSVAERTREIGIRKALGATNRHIIWQFLSESLLMSIIGGATGLLAGFFIAFLFSLILPFGIGFNWTILLTAGMISIVTGTLFGFYPALRAAKKDPIESLRQYN